MEVLSPAGRQDDLDGGQAKGDVFSPPRAAEYVWRDGVDREGTGGGEGYRGRSDATHVDDVVQRF